LVQKRPFIKRPLFKDVEQRLADLHSKKPVVQHLNNQWSGVCMLSFVQRTTVEYRVLLSAVRVKTLVNPSVRSVSACRHILAAKNKVDLSLLAAFYPVLNG